MVLGWSPFRIVSNDPTGMVLRWPFSEACPVMSPANQTGCYQSTYFQHRKQCRKGILCSLRPDLQMTLTYNCPWAFQCHNDLIILQGHNDIVILQGYNDLVILQGYNDLVILQCHNDLFIRKLPLDSSNVTMTWFYCNTLKNDLNLIDHTFQPITSLVYLV